MRVFNYGMYSNSRTGRQQRLNVPAAEQKLFSVAIVHTMFEWMTRNWRMNGKVRNWVVLRGLSGTMDVSLVTSQEGKQKPTFTTLFETTMSMIFIMVIKLIAQQ